MLSSRFLPTLFLFVAWIVSGRLVWAQANEIPGTDVSLGLLGTFSELGREGVFPNGENAFSMSTTSCNVGTVNVPWLAAMNPDHPFIAFLVGRESNGRFEQVSDRSYAKHGFFALSNSQCTPCQNPSPGTFLGVGCSDTYSTSNNGDNYWLGPPDEIDPWLGAWDPVCSHFDMGEPPVAPPADCNGSRSLTQAQANALNPLGHRVRILDSDLNVGGARFFYQAHYVVIGELEALRGDNLGSREFIPTWSAGQNQWNVSVPGTATNPLVYGSILEQWDGATVSSNSNGKNDGRVYVAVKVTGPSAGMYHYEYAVHNRDNGRGIKRVEIPVCPGAVVANVTFRDIDQDPSNDWAVSTAISRVSFSTTSDPLRWNSFYNFSFDCSAAPLAGHSLLLEEFNPGPGFDLFAVTTTAPMGPSPAVDLGFGKVGGNGLVPELRACGSLDTGGQASVLLRFAPPNGAAFLALSLSSNPFPTHGGTLVPLPLLLFELFPTDANGEFVLTGIGGGGGPLDAYLQFVPIDAGATFGVSFSNALQITFGL